MFRWILKLVFAAFIAAVALDNIAGAQGNRFPIISYGCPKGNTYWQYFPDADAAGFNTFYTTTFSSDDFYYADLADLKLIQGIYLPYCEGQTSIYESDTRPPGPFFSHVAVVGGEVFDPGPNEPERYAWAAEVNNHMTGYMQKGLFSSFYRDQNVISPGWWWSY